MGVHAHTGNCIRRGATVLLYWTGLLLLVTFTPLPQSVAHKQLYRQGLFDLWPVVVPRSKAQHIQGQVGTWLTSELGQRGVNEEGQRAAHLLAARSKLARCHLCILVRNSVLKRIRLWALFVCLFFFYLCFGASSLWRAACFNFFVCICYCQGVKVC